MISPFLATINQNSQQAPNPRLILPLLVHELVHDRVDRRLRVRLPVDDLRHGDRRSRLIAARHLLRRRGDLRQQLVLGEVRVHRG